MWFQDLFNYDFRRTEMCIIPYGTQQGEIQLLRVQHRCGLAQHHRKHAQERHPSPSGYKNHGKHEIYAKGKNVNLGSYEHSLVIDADDASRVRHLEHDIPLTAAEENRIRRKMALEEQARVRAIYEELVLKKPQTAVVQIARFPTSPKPFRQTSPTPGKPIGIAPPMATRTKPPSPRKPREAVAGELIPRVGPVAQAFRPEAFPSDIANLKRPDQCGAFSFAFPSAHPR